VILQKPYRLIFANNFIVLNVVENHSFDNRDLEIQGNAKTPAFPTPRKNIFTAAIFGQKSKITFFLNTSDFLKNVVFLGCSEFKSQNQKIPFLCHFLC